MCIRDRDRTERRTHRSGKKKRHAVKNQITASRSGQTARKPPHSPGRRNDYAILKIKHPALPGELAVFYDLGYLGVEKDFPEQASVLPCKKEPGRELAAHQKERSKLQRSVRIEAERAVSRIKKLRISSDTFRNRLCRYDTISDIVCGIVNLKARWKQELAAVP